MVRIRKPTPKRVSLTSIPKNSKKYQVSDGESWNSIAEKHKIPAGELIDFNFQTNIPEEINWYLQEYVGCKKTTYDGKNYKFSSNDFPGIIYIPLPKLQKFVLPPITIIPDQSKKLVPIDFIEKKVLFGTDQFMSPGSVKWSGHKVVIIERYEFVPKDYIESGTVKRGNLYSDATAFKKVNITRHEILWYPKKNAGDGAKVVIQKGLWFYIKLATNSLETAGGSDTYPSWEKYWENHSKNSKDDPLHRFAP